MNPWDEQFEVILRAQLPLLPADRSLQADTPLREHGLNSMKIMSLVVQLEESYGASFAEDALNFEAFATPRLLWDLVAQNLLRHEGSPASSP